MYEQKRYLLRKIRDLHEITNGGSVIEEVGEDSFSNAFDRPLKCALLYDVLKLHKEYVFNRDIPQWSCLCELCENVTLLATGVNKVLKDKLPTSPHDIVEKFSCRSTRHCMYDACCEVCSSIDVNIPDNMEQKAKTRAQPTMTTITMTTNLINQKSQSDCSNGTILTRERLRGLLGICLLPMQMNRSSNKLLY